MDSGKLVADALALIELPKQIRRLEEKIAQQQKQLSNPRLKTKIPPTQLDHLKDLLAADRLALAGYRKKLDELTS